MLSKQLILAKLRRELFAHLTFVSISSNENNHNYRRWFWHGPSNRDKTFTEQFQQVNSSGQNEKQFGNNTFHVEQSISTFHFFNGCA
jgi:hypothetical protein